MSGAFLALNHFHVPSALFKGIYAVCNKYINNARDVERDVMVNRVALAHTAGLVYVCIRDLVSSDGG